MHSQGRGRELHYTYRVGVDKHAPLALFVHGRAGNGEVMWTFRRAVPDSWHILSPQADLADPLGGWSWWEVIEGIPKEQSYQSALAAWRNVERLLHEFISAHHIAPAYTVAFGFSQGGALLSVPLQEEPEKFRGVALLASVAIPLSRKENFTGKLPSVFIGHGEKDMVIPVKSANQTASMLRSKGYEVTLVTDPVAHKIGTSGMRELKSWVQSLGQT